MACKIARCSPAAPKFAGASQASKAVRRRGHSASVIANQFAEAQSKLFRSTLIELGLILFCVSVILNLLARVIVARMASQGGSVRKA